MSIVNININKSNANINNIDGMQALHQQQVDQANAAIDVNSLVGSPIAAARYNPAKGEVNEFAKFQDSKTFKMMNTCFKNGGVDNLGNAEEIFTKALLGQKNASDKNILMDLMQQIPQKFDEVLDQLLQKSELSKQVLSKEILEDQVTANLLQEQASLEELPTDFKKFINLLKIAKADVDAQITDEHKVETIVEQNVGVTFVSKAQDDDTADENNEIENDSDVSNKNVQLESSNVSSNSSNVNNQENPGFDKKSTHDPMFMQGMNLSNASGNVVGNKNQEIIVDTGAIPPANKISTMLFLAVVLSYLQKSSELFDAIEKKSRGNADIAKLANDLLHKAQNLNTMMSNLSNKVKTLASDLQVVAGKFGIINGSTTLTEQNLGLYDLMFIERATKGEAPGFGTLTREQALTELFLLKFDPSLSQDTCNEIKNYKPPEDHPNDTYFSAIDKDTKRPVHENVASTFNGAYMWDNVTRNGQTVTWRDKQYSGSISVSFFGDAFNSWIETADRGLIKKNDTIALSDFNDLVNKYFANFPTIGFPKSNFTLFDTSKYMGKENSSIIDITTTDVAKSAPDFFRGITSMVSSYSTNLGQHQITELQQKVANSGKESQDDWAKAIEQIQKFTDAGTQAFNAFAKAC